MRIIFIFTILQVSLLLNAQTSVRQGYLDDLKIYREIVETSHSGMYLYTSKSEFDSLFFAAEKEINTNDDLDDRGYFLLMADIHTHLRCGHSSLFPSAVIFENIDSTKIAFFPIKVKFIKDSLIVANDFKELRSGDQIRSINGHTVAQIVQDGFEIISSDGYNETFKYRQLEEEFYSYLFLLYGEQSEFIIDYTSYATGEDGRFTLEEASQIDYDIEAEPYDRPYYLEYLPDNTALLTVNTFSTETKKNQKKFFRFLKKSFKDIQDKNCDNLILDIRENTGGDDGNDMELASYLINKPFKENKYRKLNTLDIPLYPELLHEQWKSMFGLDGKSNEAIQKKAKKMISREFYQGDDSAFYYKEKYVLKRDPQKTRFTGNTYVLIGGKVFSGGGLFSALVRDKSDATFVGEETGGGYYRHTGSIPLIYTLPNSKLPFSIFIVINEQDVEQQLYENGSGTKPQHEVSPSVSQFLSNEDAVLEYTKKLIENNHK